MPFEEALCKSMILSLCVWTLDTKSLFEGRMLAVVDKGMSS